MSDKREQLLDAAQDIIQRRGYNAFSYQDLGEVAGLHKATLHHYFPKKEDFVLALIKRYTALFKQPLDDIEGQTSHP